MVCKCSRKSPPMQWISWSTNSRPACQDWSLCQIARVVQNVWQKSRNVLSLLQQTDLARTKKMVSTASLCSLCLLVLSVAILHPLAIPLLQCIAMEAMEWIGSFLQFQQKRFPNTIMMKVLLWPVGRSLGTSETSRTAQRPVSAISNSSSAYSRVIGLEFIQGIILRSGEGGIKALFYDGKSRWEM